MTDSTADQLLHKIVSDFEEQLTNGQLLPGDKLPSESEVSQKYTVNRNIVRRAFRVLELGGHIDVTQGRGRYVRRPVIHAKLPRHLKTPIQSEGEENPFGAYHSKTLQLNLVKATAQVASVLDMDEASTVVSLSRVYYLGNVPTVIEKTNIKHDRFPKFFELFEKNGGSVSSVFAESGVEEIERRYLAVSASLPNAEECQLMNLPPHIPLLVVDFLSAAKDEILQCAQMKLPSDRVQIDLTQVELGA